MSRTSPYHTTPAFGVKFSIPLIHVLVTWSILALSQPCIGQTIIPYTQDPGGYGIGFARAHWASSVQKMLVFYGNSHNVFGNNSIRAFDPVTNSWDYLWLDDYTNGGLQNRDNYASLYLPRLDELWIWGGSGLEGLQGSLRSGRFNVSQKKWIASSTTDSGAFAAVVANFGGFLSDNATAWSEDADIGLIFGGSDQGNASNRYWIIEPNQSGPQPYKMSEVTGGTRPPPRAEAMNTLVAVGKDFYLFGGTSGGFQGALKDLWKFDSTTRTWTQLPDAPSGSYTPAVTYDSDQNAIVAWVYDKIFAFDLTKLTWSDQTPSTLACIFNQVALYAKTAKVHLFEGSNNCSDGVTPGPVVFEMRL